MSKTKKCKEKYCCCTCANQLELMKHPWNKEFGKGSITERCGWVCKVGLDMGEERQVIFFDREHGECELYTPRKDKA